MSLLHFPRVINWLQNSRLRVNTTAFGLVPPEISPKLEHAVGAPSALNGLNH